MESAFHTATRSLCLAAITLSLGGAALAEDAKSPPADPARQAMVANHKKAAEMHTKMAACLESAKTLDECREEMIGTCGANFGANCPMGGAGKGMMGGGMGKMGGKGGKGGGPWMNWMMNPGATAPDTTTPKK